MKIWQRYLFKHFFSAFTLFFLCLLVIYMAIDFSINGSKLFYQESTSWSMVVWNYLHYFAKFLDLFLSLSFCLACLKVLLDLNLHRELLALQIAGLSARKLLSPFFLSAGMLAIISLANSQWIAPETPFSTKEDLKKGKKTLERVFSIELSDGSELIYQKYLSEKKELFDVFWILSPKELWYIKYLEIDTLPLRGRFANHFERKEEDRLEKNESFDSCLFSEMQWNREATLQKFIPFENRSMSLLCKQAFSQGAEKQRSSAHFHYKLAQPCISFLMLFWIAPFAIRFSRMKSSFLLIAAALFTYLIIRTLLDAMLILAENQVFPPLIAIWGPVIGCLLISCSFFSRLR